jgi:hypothetical protein
MESVAAVLVVYGTLVFVPSVVCWLKGKKLWATIGFISLWHVIPMVRLAKPDSWWARRRYDGRKLERARTRFTEWSD